MKSTLAATLHHPSSLTTGTALAHQEMPSQIVIACVPFFVLSVCQNSAPYSKVGHISSLPIPFLALLSQGPFDILLLQTPSLSKLSFELVVLLFCSSVG